MPSQSALYHCRFFARENDSFYFNGSSNGTHWAVQVPDAGAVSIAFGTGDISLIPGRFGFEKPLATNAIGGVKDDVRKFLFDVIKKGIVDRSDAERGWCESSSEALSPPLSGRGASDLTGTAGTACLGKRSRQ